MLDIGLKSYAVPSPPLTDLEVKVTGLEFAFV